MAIPRPREREPRSKTTERPSTAVDRERTLLAWLERSRSSKAPLVDSPSDWTREALTLIPAQMLYHLLHIDSLSVLDLHAQRTQGAKQEAKQHRTERDQWLRVEKLLRAAIDIALRQPFTRSPDDVALYSSQLTPLLHPEGGKALPADVLAFATERGYRIPDDVPGRRIDIVHVPAIDALQWIAKNARDLADGHRLANGNPDPQWNRLARANEEKNRSVSERAAVSRMRAKLLETKLKPLGWNRGNLAELIIASESDWTPPPIVLTADCRTFKTLRGRLNNLINPRSNRRR